MKKNKAWYTNGEMIFPAVVVRRFLWYRKIIYRAPAGYHPLDKQFTYCNTEWVSKNELSPREDYRQTVVFTGGGSE